MDADQSCFVFIYELGYSRRSVLTYIVLVPPSLSSLYTFCQDLFAICSITSHATSLCTRNHFRVTPVLSCHRHIRRTACSPFLTSTWTLNANAVDHDLGYIMAPVAPRLHYGFLHHSIFQPVSLALTSPPEATQATVGPFFQRDILWRLLIL